MSTLTTLTALTTAMRASAEPKGRDQVRPERTANDGSKAEGGLPPSYANALRLARMINDDKTVARLLARYGFTKSATEADIVAVVTAYESAGTPNAAVRFLRERIALYPAERRPRAILAAFYTRSGQTAKAVEAWREQREKFGEDALTFQDAHAYARDLSRTGDVDGAYAELQRMRAAAPDDAKEYWSDLALLAWERDDDATALVAYEKLYEHDPKIPHAGARYVALLAGAGREDEAVKVALAEHQRTADITLVLFVAHLRAAKADWKGVNAVLDAADKSETRALSAARQEELFLLRGESKRQLGDLRGAAEAYRRALAAAPESATTKASLLYTLVELGDLVQLRKLTLAWAERPGRSEPLLWSPLAASFVKLGMHERALPFLVLQFRTDPKNGRVLLEMADALSHVGQYALGHELRRRAVVRLRSEAIESLRASRRSADDLHVVESTALVVRERSGAPQAEGWLRAIRATNPRFVGQEELAADWYLATDRVEFARKLLAIKRSARAPSLRRFRLALALADENHAEAQRLLDAAGPELSADDRVHGRLMLGHDRLALAELGTDPPGPGESPNGSAPSPDQPNTLAELAAIQSYHRPNVRAGASYLHVTGLDAFGPFVSGSHDAFGGRMIYKAEGLQMSDRSDLLALGDPLREGSAFVVHRRTNVRAVTELGAGASYQDPDGHPVAKAQFFDQRLVTKRLGIMTDVRAGDTIYDTSFLRTFAVRNSATVGARYDEARWYASADVSVRQDQSRRYEHLAWDAVAVGEAGYKITTSEPHVSVGAQVEGSARQNRDVLPGRLGSALNPRLERERALPPSFYLVGGVVHLSRGDYLERYRPDRAPFPRYDCELALGAIFPESDAAFHVLCGASVRAPGGYTSLLAFYNRGIAGVRNNENAEVAASYTIPF